jgi:hypothetical protein
MSSVMGATAMPTVPPPLPVRRDSVSGRVTFEGSPMKNLGYGRRGTNSVPRRVAAVQSGGGGDGRDLTVLDSAERGGASPGDVELVTTGV